MCVCQVCVYAVARHTYTYLATSSRSRARRRRSNCSSSLAATTACSCCSNAVSLALSRAFIHADVFICCFGVDAHTYVAYGVATTRRLLKIIRLFCKGDLYKRRHSAKETNNFTEPTNRSHPILRVRSCVLQLQV